jgi:hypothetical protein
MKAPRTLVGRGVLAGAIGALALALWFLVIDFAAGEPFRTPAFLASALGLGDIQLGALSVTVYTLVHFAAFALVGVIAAWFVDRLEVVPGALLGIVLGFLLFNLVFYGSVLITRNRTDIVAALGWPQVLAGNIIAGSALFYALAKLGVTESVRWSKLLAEHYTIREGLITGVIGAAAVAIWFLIYDVITGRILFTPAALGSAVFLGARGAADVQITAVTVLGYSALHVTAFVLTGLVAAGVVAAAEEYTEAVLLGGVLLLVTFEAFSIGMFSILAYWLVETLTWKNILGANAVAALCMGGYLYYRHPALARDLRQRELEEDLVRDVPAPGQPPPPVHR